MHSRKNTPTRRHPNTHAKTHLEPGTQTNTHTHAKKQAQPGTQKHTDPYVFAHAITHTHTHTHTCILGVTVTVLQLYTLQFAPAARSHDDTIFLDIFQM